MRRGKESVRGEGGQERVVMNMTNTIRHRYGNILVKAIVYNKYMLIKKSTISATQSSS